MDELKIDIFGRVQGVGFRQFVKKKAGELGVAGIVRNRIDGSVLIIAQSERKKLEEFLSVVQKGPLLSKVSSFSYTWRKPSADYRGFIIGVESGFIEDQASSFKNLGMSFLKDKTVPLHVAIIPDGNRRWAKERGLGAEQGHRSSGELDKIMGLLSEAKNLGIKYLTFWVFSTENWKRSKTEVDYLFDLLREKLGVLKDKLVENKIKFRHIGRKDRIPEDLLGALKEIENETRNFKDFNLQICLDYGGRDELARAVNKIISSGVREVNERDISKYLDTDDVPDPDLIIRTSGEQRMSGFMPFQATYSELYFSSLYFPDFGPEQLRAAVMEFSRRKRNFGA